MLIAQPRYKFSKGENAMNWDLFVDVWNEFLVFMDRVVQWMKFVFTGDNGVGGDTWPPEDYPNIDD